MGVAANLAQGLFGAGAAPAPGAVRGQGVVLRHPVLADFEAWADLRALSRDHLAPWEPLWPADDLTRPAFRRRLRRYADEIRRDEAYPYLVFREEDGALVGGLTLGHVRRGVSGAASLGYWAGAPFAGRGLMGAAVRAAARHAFGPLSLYRIEAACLPGNAASIRLLERVGFQREGLARAYLSIAGRRRDHLLYALLRHDPVHPPAGPGAA